MTLPLQITYRNMQPSPAVTERVQAEAAKLDRFYSRITSCRIMIEAPHRHHKWGELFHIRVELGVPGADLVIKHEPSPRPARTEDAPGKLAKRLEPEPRHRDIYVAIHDTFKDVRRRLEDHVRKMRGDVKMHTRVPGVRKAKLADSAPKALA